jgi:hypothetical protein
VKVYETYSPEQYASRATFAEYQADERDDDARGGTLDDFIIATIEQQAKESAESSPEDGGS